MGRLLIAAIVVVLSCEAGLTQALTNTPSIGLTSPLGIPGSTSPGSPTGIPLGATEIDPGGIGPTPIGPTSSSSTCVSTSSSTGVDSGAAGGTMGTTSLFDGGGISSATTSSSCSLPSSSAVSSAGTASPLSTPGVTATFGLNGGAIPLGATEIDGGGVSSLIGIPVPSVTSTPCVGSTTTNLAAGTTGMTSSSGC
jgi:hypothetical protein